MGVEGRYDLARMKVNPPVPAVFLFITLRPYQGGKSRPAIKSTMEIHRKGLAVLQSGDSIHLSVTGMKCIGHTQCSGILYSLNIEAVERNFHVPKNIA